MACIGVVLFLGIVNSFYIVGERVIVKGRFIYLFGNSIVCFKNVLF